MPHATAAGLVMSTRPAGDIDQQNGRRAPSSSGAAAWHSRKVRSAINASNVASTANVGS